MQRILSTINAAAKFSISCPLAFLSLAFASISVVLAHTVAWINGVDLYDREDR